jgi:hypothetical protein
MPRSAVSEADRRLVEDAGRLGAVVTARQLERWRAAGLLGPNIRRPLGRGRGSSSEPPACAAELAAWLAGNARPGRRPRDLALLAFAAGLAVPESTVRTAFTAAATGTRLPAEDSLPPGAEPEDIADEAVASGRRFTMVPARIKRIDGGLARLGVDWSFPALAGLDPGRSDSRLAGRDLAHVAVQMVLTGGKGINMGIIGAVVRALAPAGGIAPLAGQIEYRWPISRGEEPSGLPDDDEVLATLLDGGGDLRGQARDLAMATPAAELLDAFRLAAGLPGWADRTCAAVEREIAAGQLGEASREWVTSALGGLPRLLLGTALRDRDAGPASTAETALTLIFMRNKFRTVRQLVPAGSFDVMDNPMVAPSFLIDFLNR